MSGELEAFLWGMVVGCGLLVGAGASYLFSLRHRLIAAVTAFGGGVLISVLAFSLTEEAYLHGGFASATAGFLSGALIFSAANWLLSIWGAKHRKRCTDCVDRIFENKEDRNGIAIAIGSILDDLPEAVIVGISLAAGGMVDKAVLIGFFLANIPEGLASTSGLKRSGFSGFYIFGIWLGVTILTGLAGLLGYAEFGAFPEATKAFITSLAAGGILAMVAETMIPEAFDEAQAFIGFITAIGFLVFFLLLRTGW